jgi:Na+/H+ antiporter NhaD/arsenite permease-like protein
LWWALPLEADFGGNASIFGASANVITISLATKRECHISYWQFAESGIPVTFLGVMMVIPYVLLRYL